MHTLVSSVNVCVHLHACMCTVYACMAICVHVDWVYIYEDMYNIFLVSISVGGMYTIVSPLRDKWKDIGLKVGLFTATLEAIDKSNNGRTDQCLYSVLTKWLQRRDDVWKKGGTTWNVLIQALKHVGADDDVLAACKAEANTPDQTIHARTYVMYIFVLRESTCMPIIAN